MDLEGAHWSRSQRAVISSSSSVTHMATISPEGAMICEPPIMGTPSSFPALATPTTHCAVLVSSRLHDKTVIPHSTDYCNTCCLKRPRGKLCSTCDRTPGGQYDLQAYDRGRPQADQPMASGRRWAARACSALGACREQHRCARSRSNGLIRRLHPKQSSFAEIGEEELKWIEMFLNDRPRKCLGWMTPREKLAAFLGYTP